MIEDGRRARKEARHDPGPGQPLRGLHGLGQRADRERRHPDPLRPGRRSTSNRSPTEEALAVMGRLANSSRRPAEPLDLRRGQRPARLRGGRIGLHDQLHLRLRQRPGRSARRSARRWAPPASPGRRGPAEQAAAGRLQPRGQLLLEQQGRRLRSRRLPGRQAEPADRGRTRRAAALPLRPLRRQSRDRRPTRASPAWSRNRSRPPGRGRPPPPTRTSPRRSSAPCTRRTRSTPKTPNRSTTN